MKNRMMKFILIVVIVLSLSLMISGQETRAQTSITGGADPAIGSYNPANRPSGSPYLRVPEDKLNYPPVFVSEAIDAPEGKDAGNVVSYNLATGETTEIAYPLEDNDEPQDLSIAPNPGLLPTAYNPELNTVFPPDDRQRITPTDGFPWRTVVYLYITWSNGDHSAGSGAIIDNFHVLTAGHCVYDYYHGHGWASSIMVVPAQDEAYMPYNYALSTSLHTFTGWKDDGNTRSDMGWIVLDRNIGAFTGWMGRKTMDSGNPIYRGGLNTAGYPCSVYNADCPYPKTPDHTMWHDADYGRDADGELHWYWMDTMPGQSGSPVWYKEGADRYIITVHTTGGNEDDGNHGTRLNNSKYDALNNSIAADTPPTDYADLLDDGDNWSGFSPTAISPNLTTFYAWSNVRNVGTADAGGFYVSYYASSDTNITTGDWWLGDAYVSSVWAFNWGDANFSGTTPYVPDGWYYFGWIINPYYNVTEFDYENNTAVKTPYSLLVDGTPPYNPTDFNSVPAAGVWSNLNVINVNWDGATDGSGVGVYGYSIQWSHIGGTIPDTIVDTTNFYATSPHLSDGTWYLHIRTVDALGNWNSGAKHFGPWYIDATPPSPPTWASTAPCAVWGVWQNTCADPNFTWGGASDGGGSGILRYWYYWGPDPNGTSSNWTTTTGYDPGPVSSPSVYFLRVQVEDNAHNKSNWATKFTFLYDTSQPINPTSIDPGCSATDNVWQNTCADPYFTWSGASDPSGVVGYYYYWGDNPSGTYTDFTKMTSYNPAAVSNPSTNYLRLQTKDFAGNSSVWETVFTLKYDAIPPESSMGKILMLVPGKVYQVLWEGKDLGSGIATYDVQYRVGSAGFWIDWISRTRQTSALFGPTSPVILVPGQTYYFRIRAHDLAGNVEAYPIFSNDWVKVDFVDYVPDVLRE